MTDSRSSRTSEDLDYLLSKLRCVPRDLKGGASGQYPIGELVHEAAFALEKAESDKNWLRTQRDVAEEKLTRSESTRITLAEAIAAVDAEEECPGQMPDDMWAAVSTDRDACEEGFRIAVRQTKGNIKERLMRLHER